MLRPPVVRFAADDTINVTAWVDVKLFATRPAHGPAAVRLGNATARVFSQLAVSWSRLGVQDVSVDVEVAADPRLYVLFQNAVSPSQLTATEVAPLVDGLANDSAHVTELAVVVLAGVEDATSFDASAVDYSANVTGLAAMVKAAMQAAGTTNVTFSGRQYFPDVVQQARLRCADSSIVLMRLKIFVLNR